MNIQQEEILIKDFISGTTITYFSTHLPFNQKLQNVIGASPELIPTIVHLNNLNQIVSLSTFDGGEVWTLDNDNNYTQQHQNAYITGYSFSVEQSNIISDNQINTIRNSFTESMDLVYNTLSMTSITESGIAFSGTQLTKVDYVLSKHSEIDDFYVNIKLNRTTATLDTFNVYNNIVNSMPTQEADSGVVFGRLMALQTIRDSEGNRIKIPLRNVPVGIFNPSEDYPTSSSFSNDGDRIFLNVKESAKQNEYFNIESFDLDKSQLLRSASKFTTVPDQYKYVTTTNDEGEFIIYNAPTGSQIVMFEVDLLKQGLTRDEIALNFFPFPPDDDAVVDQIPNFSFKQFPINVVPAWGTVQTGYTELNVTVNMDLRKWTTYFFPPVSVTTEKLESSFARSAANTVKINVRDMTKVGYPVTQIKMATIQNEFDRVINQQLNWHQEFAQIRNKADFYKFGTYVVKLPANLYDPNAFKTDSDGVPMSNNKNQKGVWLSSYQFKLFVHESDKVTRKTGAYRQSANVTYSHYDLNYTIPNTLSLNQNETRGEFPYEKPWTIEYPNKYSIPKKPTQERFDYDKQTGRSIAYTIPGGDVYYLEEPSFSDGDLIGKPVNFIDNKIGGGFGVQLAYNTPIPNTLGQSITKDYMYKYESDISYNEEYANGFQPLNSSRRFYGTSKVVGGEKYQRLESGYGYFLKPQGWPRVARRRWWNSGEVLFDVDTAANGGGTSNSPGLSSIGATTSDWLYAEYPHQNDIYNLDSQNCALALNSRTQIKNGTLDFYRVINPSPANLSPITNFVIPTQIRIRLGDIDRLSQIFIFNRGDIEVTFTSRFSKTITHSNGSLIAPGGLITLGINQYVYGTQNPDGLYSGNGFALKMDRSLGWPEWIMPGNKSFNTTTNRYDYALYEFWVVTSPSNYRDSSSIAWAPTFFAMAPWLQAFVPASTPNYYFYSSNYWHGANVPGITSAVPNDRSRPIDNVYIST